MRRRQATRQEAAKGQGKSSESREAIRFSAVKSQLRGVTRWAISRKRRSGFKGLARRGGQDRDFRGPLKDTRSFVSARTSAFIDLRNADGGPSSSMLFSSASCRRTRQGPGRSRDSVTRVYTRVRINIRIRVRTTRRSRRQSQIAFSMENAFRRLRSNPGGAKAATRTTIFPSCKYTGRGVERNRRSTPVANIALADNKFSARKITRVLSRGTEEERSGIEARRKEEDERDGRMVAGVVKLIERETR